MNSSGRLPPTVVSDVDFCATRFPADDPVDRMLQHRRGDGTLNPLEAGCPQGERGDDDGSLNVEQPVAHGCAPEAQRNAAWVPVMATKHSPRLSACCGWMNKCDRCACE